MATSVVKVNVKWNKEVFNGIEVDLNEPPIVFKSQLFALTNVPVERQKIMGKGMLKDDNDWGTFKSGMKDGVTLMLMGTAELPAAPKEKTVFAEDLPQSEQDNALSNLPPGLMNLDNTCYMNATLQCLNSVPELTDQLGKFNSGNLDEPATTITACMKDVVRQLKTNKSTVIPALFLNRFRAIFPNFGEQVNNRYKQQDAEEAWTQLLWCLKKLPKVSNQLPGDSAVDQLFEGKFETTYKCLDAPNEEVVKKIDSFDKLPCHIQITTNSLTDGVKLSLDEKIRKASPTLNKEAEYSKTSKVSALPYYLTVQFVRFFWKPGNQKKAKIVRPVQFPFELDAYEFCTESLQKELAPKRLEYREEVEKGSGAYKPKPLTNDTGYYELVAVLTHKGIEADGGHYVAWVKDTEGSGWLLFDDDKVSVVHEDEIRKLDGKGGAQHHIAYMCLYKTKQPKKK